MTNGSRRRLQSPYHLLATGQDVMPTRFAFGDTDIDELAATLAADLDDEGRVGTTYMCVLVDAGRDLVLIDSGLPADDPDDRPPLLGGLEALGVTPSDVSLVVLSHAHVDHLGGLLHRGAPVFSNARHVISEQEWQFWMSGHERRELGPELYEDLKQAARAYLTPLNDVGLLDLVTGETRLDRFIRLIPSPGHTPGHLSVEVTTSAEVLLYVGDAILHEAMVRHPTWTGLVDADAAATISTRLELLAGAERDAAVIAGGHLRGTGRVARTEDGFSWSSLS